MVKDGKLLERIVQLIEQSISPDATVEHNVQMPILNSTQNRTTQCDLVVRTGKPPRQTTTIIEVQDRNSKVKPNDFRGWEKKLEQVDAQHLICVSRQEFPKSIKESASSSGGAIMLITLKKATPESLPLDFVNFYFHFQQFEITALKDTEISFSKSQVGELGKEIKKRKSVNSNDLCWSLDGYNLTSLYILCRNFYSIPNGQKSGTGEISFDIKEGSELYYVVNNHFIKVGLILEFEWTNEIIEEPFSILSYEQDEAGALAWVAEINCESAKEKIDVKATLIKSDEGYLLTGFYIDSSTDLKLSLFRKTSNNDRF